MKIGSFVGKKSVSLAKNEINEFVTNIKKGVEQLNFVKLNKMNVEETDNSLNITISFKKPNTMRDSYGNCYKPNYIVVQVRKSLGYDENVCGKFYEWKDGYEPTLDIQSYSTNINMIGDYRKKYCRNVEHRVGIIPTDYQYGTEMTDFDIVKAFEKIRMYLLYSSEK